VSESSQEAFAPNNGSPDLFDGSFDFYCDANEAPNPLTAHAYCQSAPLELASAIERRLQRFASI